MSLYENLEVKPCNILGFLHFEVCNGNITLEAFAYEKDAVLFKEAAQQSGQADGALVCPICKSSDLVTGLCKVHGVKVQRRR